MENSAVKRAGSHLSWLESESIHIRREAVADEPPRVFRRLFGLSYTKSLER